jgi:3-dehydroquinate synthase
MTASGATATDKQPERLAMTLRSAEKQVFYTCYTNNHDLWNGLACFVKERFPHYRLVVMSDDNVEKLYGAALYQALYQALHLIQNTNAKPETLIVPAGEASKSRAEKERLEDRLFELGCGRDTVIIALGGGVIGDLAGYVAATFLRGVPLIHVPTTLLAQVDSSIGGKTGINHRAGKNLLGAFYQPEAIMTSTSFLTTLPSSEFRSGMAEVLKYAATLDSDTENGLWGILERNANAIQEGNAELMRQIILRSAALKIRIVENDERESGLRAILNFGHTVGHAFEALGNYTIPHGFCVAAGMRVALRLSQMLLGYPEESVQRFDQLLARYNLALEYSSRFSTDDIWQALLSDKKSRSGLPRFVLMRSHADYALAEHVSKEHLHEALIRVQHTTPVASV